MRPDPVLVTGAAGFIGRSVLDALQGSGRSVKAGVRAGALPPRLDQAANLMAVPCDLDDPRQVEAAMAGAGAVVHAAYGRIERMLAQTDTLLDAMDRAGTRRLVYFSSIAVYGEREGEVDETLAPGGRLDPYGAAKLDCETRVQGWVAARGGREAVILRPGIVYGRASPFWIDKLVRRIASGAWGTFGRRGEGRAALVHVADVADIVRRALDVAGDPPPCLTLNVTGPECPTWNDYFTAVAGGLGMKPLRAFGPLELHLRQAAGFGAKALRRAGIAPPPGLALAPTPSEMRLFGRAVLYGADKAAVTLGWQPAIGLREGLARSLPAQAPMT